MKQPNITFATLCSLNQYDESFMVTWQSDKSQCTIPDILPGSNFFKTSLSGNKVVREVMRHKVVTLDKHCHVQAYDLPLTLLYTCVILQW